MVITVILKRLYFDSLVASGCTYNEVHVLQGNNYTVPTLTSDCACRYFYAQDSNVAVSKQTLQLDYLIKN